MEVVDTVQGFPLPGDDQQQTDPSSEDLHSAYRTDLQNVLRYAAPIFLLGMIIEMASHLLVFTPSFLPLPALGFGLMSYLTLRQRRGPVENPEIWAGIMTVSILAVVVQHILAGAYVTSAFVLTMAVLAVAALVLSLVPMLLFAGAAWLLLVWVFVLMPYPVGAVAPMPLLVAIIGALLFLARRRAVQEAERAKRLQLILAHRQARAEREAQQSEFMQSVVGGLAHNLANQVQVLTFAVEDENPMGAHAAEALQAAERARSLLVKLQTYTGMSRRPQTPVEVEEICDAIRRRVSGEISVSCRSSATLKVDHVMLVEAIMELVRNAETAMASKHGALHGIRLDAYDSGAAVHFDVHDQGGGFDAEILRRATDPFATTEPARRPGLGLSFAKGAAEQCGGVLTVVNSGAGDTTVRVSLPALNVGGAG